MGMLRNLVQTGMGNIKGAAMQGLKNKMGFPMASVEEVSGEKLGGFEQRFKELFGQLNKGEGESRLANMAGTRPIPGAGGPTPSLPGPTMPAPPMGPASPGPGGSPGGTPGGARYSSYRPQLQTQQQGPLRQLFKAGQGRRY